MATEAARKTGYTGIEIHGHSIRVDFMYKGVRYRHTLGIEPTKANIKHAGFLPAERAYVDRWLGEYEFVDVIRSLAGDIQGPYTWWSQRGRAFDNNVGWRIDYQFATPELAETARGFVIDKAPSYDARWSDHAPLTVTYDV